MSAPATAAPSRASFRLPEGFVLGVATAAYQIEGGATLDGRGPSVWDVFARTPGRIRDGSTAEMACDHYRRFEADVALLAELGIRDYRFSISWPRVLPDGTGRVNEAGLAFYERLLDALGRHGVTPHVTLFHWDSPQALEERYGSWRSRRMAGDFAAYVDVVVRRLGDRVRHWMTMNEIPCFTHMAYGVGALPPHAPGTLVARPRDVWQTSHHALLGHGLAVQAVRASSPGPCRVTLVDNPVVPVPVTEAEADVEAARRAFRRLEWNGFVTVPALTGRYDDELLAALDAAGERPEIEAGDDAIIGQPLDGLGLNVYTGRYVRAAEGPSGYEVLAFPARYPRLDMPWLHLVPEALYWAPRLATEELGFAGDLFVTENGCATRDVLTGAGEVLDLDRVSYLRASLRQVHRALSEGYRLAGYFLWSFLDNFEWSFGTAKRFGIVHVAYETQARTPKESARWYSECIRQHRVV